MDTKTKKTKSFNAKKSKQKRFFAKKKRFCKFAATYQATCLLGTLLTLTFIIQYTDCNRIKQTEL